MDQPITVAIVTRNRKKDLHECLLSLFEQTHHPQKILIIDNNSSDKTQDVIREFSKILPIKTVTEKKVGYPIVYNRALREAKTKWVAFIDDDCVADKHWFHEIMKAIQKYYNYTAIAGASLNYYPQNIYACSFQFWYDYWRQRSIRKRNIVDYRCLDSRNIIYNRQLFIAHGIVFDDTFSAGAEDGDLGMQIQNNNLKAAYVSQLLIYHKEPKTMTAFFRKKRAYAKAGRYLTKKWGYKLLPSKKMTQFRMMRAIFLLVTKQLSPLSKVKMFCLIVADYIFSRYHMYGLLMPHL
jgi:GT2 family glycosyltransferase